MSESLKAQRSGVNLDDFERQLFAGSKSGQSGDDPLAELSRIVGKADPFKGVFAKTHASAPARQEPRLTQAAPAAAPSAPVTPLAFSPPRRPTPVVASAPVNSVSPPIRPSAPAAASAASFAPKYFETAEPSPQVDEEEAEFFTHLTAAAQEAEADSGFEPVHEAQDLSQPRAGRMALVGILLVAAIGSGAFLGMRSFERKPTDGSLPVIKAAQTPVKVEPPKTDAAKITPDQASMSQDASAVVSGKVEQPVAIVQQPGQPPIKIARTVPLSGDQAQALNPDSTNAQSIPGAPVPANGFPEPHRVKTVSVRPDGSLISGEPTPPAPAAAAMDENAPAAAVADAAPVLPTPEAAPKPANVPVPQRRPGDAGSVTAAATPAATTETPAKTPKSASAGTTRSATSGGPLQIAPATSAKPEKLAAAEAPAKATAAGSYAVQLAAPASEAEAKGLIARLQSKYGAIFSGYPIAVHKADVNGRTIYRVRLENMAKDEAVRVCEKLRSAGGQCFIAR